MHRSTNYTWKDSQSIYDLPPPWLHADPVFTHHQSKHDKGKDLTGVGLQKNTTDDPLVLKCNGKRANAQGSREVICITRFTYLKL